MVYYGLIITLCIVVPLLCISIYYNFKFAVTILKVQEALEETLDTLDERFESIEEILKIPLFFDNPEIRRVHGDIKNCRNSVLSVADTLIDSFGQRTNLKQFPNDENKDE